MVTLAGIDSYVNSGRQHLLDTIGRAPDSTGLQSIFLVGAILSIIILYIQFRKGTEERKAMYTPFAFLVFCVSMIGGFSVKLIAWIIIGLLMLAMVKKLKAGDFKGTIIMVVFLYFICFLLSVNTPMLLAMGGVVTVVAALIRKANVKKVFGNSKAANLMKQEGYPVTKERRVMRKLRHIANKGFSWTKDGVVRSADKIKQRFARRAMMNEAEQMREAEVVASTEKVSETMSEQQNQLQKLEQRDMSLVEAMLKYCKQLRDYLTGLGDQAVDTEKKMIITKASHSILKQSHVLVKNALEEETLMEKANRVLEQCMEIVHNSAHEATQLEEHKDAFKELRRAAKTDIDTMRKEIKHESREIAKGIERAKHSDAQGVGNRVALLKKRDSGLRDVESKLGDIESYIMRIDKLLMRINSKEDAKIQAMKKMSEKAKGHAGKLHKYDAHFKKESGMLQAKYEKYQHISEKEEGTIADVELLDVTDGTMEMFDHLKNLAQISSDYHTKELQPLLQEMVEVTQNIAHLSKVSQYLTKLYFRLSQANDQLTKMAAIVDQNPESKRKLASIWKTEEFEQKLTKVAYRRGKGVVNHIKKGYGYLKQAYDLMQRHLEVLRGYYHLMETAKLQTGDTLNKAFKKMIGQEIKQTKILEKETATAEHKLAQAKRMEKGAKRAAA